MRGKGRRWTGAAWAPLAVAVLASFPAVGQAAAQAKDQFYEYHVTPNVMVPMQDGVRMATDVYRPARNGQPVQGRWPVVLFRIPYNKLQPRYIAQARFFAEHGYVYVAQDVRGRFASEGLYHPFGTELSPDGYDSVVWASKQPWSNDRVATIGISYGGLTQITMGVEDPPGLAAQFVQQIWDKGWENGMYVNGAFHMRRIGWITGQASVSREAAQDPLVRVAIERMNEDLMSWVDRFPHAFRRGAYPLALARTTRNSSPPVSRTTVSDPTGRGRAGSTPRTSGTPTRTFPCSGRVAGTTSCRSRPRSSTCVRCGRTGAPRSSSWVRGLMAGPCPTRAMSSSGWRPWWTSTSSGSAGSTSS